MHFVAQTLRVLIFIGKNREAPHYVEMLDAVDRARVMVTRSWCISTA
jgi:hypothetical protein